MNEHSCVLINTGGGPDFSLLTPAVNTSKTNKSKISIIFSGDEHYGRRKTNKGVVGVGVWPEKSSL
jgi:hypothetical protein